MERAICNISHIPAGEGRAFDAGGVRLAVFHTRAGAVFATQAECPHRGGPLADGLVDAASVVCPLHDRTFDLATGHGIGTDCDLRTFPARLAPDGTVLVATQAATASATS